jgi:hypothetical protein
MLPNFIGIGAPKAGTTWLFKCLQDHPQVFIAKVKETKFFDEEIIEGRMNEYEKHFVGSEGYTAIGEVSVRYLSSKRAAERIKKFIPDVKLFVSLRNPVDQIYSHYWHLARQNFHQSDTSKVPQSFEEALDRFKDRLIEPALYYKHIKRWLKCFDKSQLLIVFYDDIRSRPLQVINNLYSYLGIDNKFRPQSIKQTGPSVRRGTSPRNPKLGQIHAQLYNQLNRKFYYHFKRLVGAWTADRIKDILKIRLIMEFFFMQKGYPNMLPQTRKYLRKCVADDIQSLSRLTGCNLRHWR